MLTFQAMPHVSRTYLWNKLPDNLKNCGSLHTFKLIIKGFLMLHAKLQSAHYDFYMYLYMCTFYLVSLCAKVEYIYCNWPAQYKYIGK